jgi:hypothetical protein
VLRRMGDGWRIVHDHSSPSPLSPLPEDSDETESAE